MWGAVSNWSGEAELLSLINLWVHVTHTLAHTQLDPPFVHLPPSFTASPPSSLFMEASPMVFPYYSFHFFLLTLCSVPFHLNLSHSWYLLHTSHSHQQWQMVSFSPYLHQQVKIFACYLQPFSTLTYDLRDVLHCISPLARDNKLFFRDLLNILNSPEKYQFQVHMLNFSFT